MMHVAMTRHALYRAKQRCKMCAEQAKEDARTAILLNIDALESSDTNAKEVSGDVAKWVVMEADDCYVVITCEGYKINGSRHCWFSRLTGRRSFRRGTVKR